MAKTPNFRMGRRNSPPGKLNTYRRQVRQWTGRGDGVEPPVDVCGLPPDNVITGGSYVALRGKNCVYITYNDTTPNYILVAMDVIIQGAGDTQITWKG